jgi:hypothetical protein
MPKKSVKWTLTGILDRGVDALGIEVDRLAGLAETDGRAKCHHCGAEGPGLNTVEAKMLADHLKAAVKMSQEEREAAKFNNGKGNLAEQIAAALADDTGLWSEVQQHLGRLQRPGRSAS